MYCFFFVSKFFLKKPIKKSKDIDDDKRALELTKRMLRRENELRLSDVTVARYAESQADAHKSAVTEAVQRQVSICFFFFLNVLFITHF